MSSRKVSNFYIPNQSKWFLMASYSKSKPQDLSRRNDQEELMRDFIVPVGIIDACLINKEYSELLQELAIDTYSNDEALTMIQKTIQEYEGNKEQDPDVQILDSSKDNPNTDEIPQGSEYETQVIYLYRTTKLSYATIALKLDVSEQFVRASIDQYKRNVREWLKINIRRANAKKTKIDDGLIAKIKSFCVENSNRVITIDDIKRGVWHNVHDAKAPSNSTISKTL